MSNPRSPVSLYLNLSAKLREFGELPPTTFQARTEVKSVAHSCGIFKKEPWPKCCREASAAFSKEMEERYFREKLNL